MTESLLAIDDIIKMTMDVGEDWAVAHAKRLLVLVKQICRDLPYDEQVMELATYMHDWGAFPKYIQKDVEHALRSRQMVKSAILPHLNLTADQKEILLETIELHDYRDMHPTKSNEALLLREADMARVPWYDGHGTRVRTWSKERGDLLQTHPIASLRYSRSLHTSACTGDLQSPFGENGNKFGVAC